MKNFFVLVLSFLLFYSCSHKKQLIYISDSKDKNLSKINYSQINNNIEIGDVLKIDVVSKVPEAASAFNSSYNDKSFSIELLQLNGYLVDKNRFINFPVLGEISVEGLDESRLEKKIENLLLEKGHLKDAHVKVRKINSKFTVLGEVKNAGTFHFYEQKINIFQAIGYAGDLNISAKRKNITLVREENGVRKSYKISLIKSELMDKPYYYIKNNDIIIIEPNFSKIKSAGFIGSPSSIASITSLLLSVTLLIINK